MSCRRQSLGRSVSELLQEWFHLMFTNHCSKTSWLVLLQSVIINAVMVVDLYCIALVGVGTLFETGFVCIALAVLELNL